MRLVLASTSPYRRDLLARLGLPFSQVSPEVDEAPLPDEAPAELAARLARAKAEAVAKAHPDACVIGSDQVAELGGQPLGKPGGREQAIAQLQAALKVQPMHQRARWFLGIALRQRGEHAEAARTWEPLLAVVDANTAAALRPQVEAARRDAGLAPLPAAPAPAASTGGLQVHVALDPQLAQRHAGASVFVIARLPGGPPMPVAVEKHALATLPAAVTLDDADSPMPTQKLSALQEVEVFARLSQSGNAMRQQGDVDSKPVRVKLPASEPVELRLP